MRVSCCLGGLGREAKGLRGAWVLHQGPGLKAMRAWWALAVQSGLGMRWGRVLTSWPRQRLEWGVWGGQPLWVQSRCLLDMGMRRRTWWSLVGGLGG